MTRPPNPSTPGPRPFPAPKGHGGASCYDTLLRFVIIVLIAANHLLDDPPSPKPHPVRTRPHQAKKNLYPRPPARHKQSQSPSTHPTGTPAIPTTPRQNPVAGLKVPGKEETWPRPPWHPRTDVHEAKVQRPGAKCPVRGGKGKGLTAAQMRDAWMRMRAVTVVPRQNTDDGERSREKEKRVRWGGVEVWEYENEDELEE